MKTFTYSVSGFLAYGEREVIVGDALDFPITSEIAGVPETIRTYVIAVTTTMVEGVEGRDYEIQYDETLLGGYLLGLDPCCDVGAPTPVTLDLLLQEFQEQQVFLQSQIAIPDAPILHRQEGSNDLTDGATAIHTEDPLALFDELGLDGNLYDFQLQVTAAITPKSGDGTGAFHRFTLVGSIDNGVYLVTETYVASSGLHIMPATSGAGVSISFKNFTATDYRYNYSSNFSVFKR